MSNDIGRLTHIAIRAAIRYISRKNKAGETETESSAPQKETSNFAVGAIMTGFGLFMLLLSKEGGGFVVNELTPYAVLLIGSGLASLLIGAVRKLCTREKPSGRAVLPETQGQEKKLAEQKQLLESGLITKEEYEEKSREILEKQEAL